MDALPPDPYAALGVAKDATTAAIKAQYRKLVLRLHPDKVQDESKKQEASDKFHQVQTAYEIVGDEDRRQRYDAQCRLAELKREIEREGGVSRGYGDVRSAPPPPRAPADFSRGWDSYRSGRVSPNYEERRPDYFDVPRERSKKDDAYERSSKRSSPRDAHKKSRPSERKPKESERYGREERSKRMDQDVRREREKKFAHVSAEELVSDPEDYERIPRSVSEDDVRRQRAAAEESRRRQDEEPFPSERTAKYYAQTSDAREYMARGGFAAPEPTVTERRPSPTRQSSSRDHIETVRRDGGKRPISYRTGSGRPGPTSRDSQRRPEIVEEPEEASRRAPPLNKTVSSPENMRPPMERRRSNSMQDDARDVPSPSVKPPGMKRAETMPYPPTNTDSRRKEPSKPRRDGRNTFPTPEATPEPPPSRKPSYGNNAYFDEPEPVSPHSPAYQTVYREPPPVQAPRPRYTRSPSPIREPRERSRGTTGKQYPAAAPPPPPPANKRTTSTTYVYPTETTEPYSRPVISRENSGRLFGEIPSSRKYSPPADEIRYSPKPRPEDVRKSSGYKARPRSEKRYTDRNGTPISVR